jgi:protein kinase
MGFFHRDIKPENLLWDNDTLKIADFGLAREIRSRPPYTEYISTRWYRAPEIVLRHEFYNSPVDIWAVGAIMAELYTLKPIFQGSSETDQLFKILSILGTPGPANWPDGAKLAARLGIRLPQFTASSLTSVLPTASPDAIDLLAQILSLDPSKRPNAAQALQHAFFKGVKCPIQDQLARIADEEKVKQNLPDSVMTEDEDGRRQLRNREALLFTKDPPSQKRAISLSVAVDAPQIDDIFDGIM